MVDCKECFKYYNRVVAEGCTFCHDYQFQEIILCDLLRVEKDENELKCHSFKRNLSVVGENKRSYEYVKDDDQEITIPDRQKWLKAYALQQWKFDPDKIFSNLSFHLCLITKERGRIWDQVKEGLDKILSIFSDSSGSFDGKVSFLCAGKDHVHLHIELSPDSSPDEVVRKIVAFSEAAMKTEFPEYFEHNEGLFEKAYFIETIGY
jgi:REP element-mobilizing transposase RayT